MSKTDRVRVYYNLHKKCFSIQDYKTGLVTKHTNQLNLSNAMFVVRKSGNERVRSEGKKNVHAFVNGIVNDKQDYTKVGVSYKVRYNPYEMDYFHYERIVNNKPRWIPVDNHWIGNVYLNIVNGKPVMYADIDKLGDTKDDKRSDTKDDKRSDTKDDKEFGVTELLNSQFFKSSVVGGKFLRKKRKIIDSRNKIKKKTVVI